MESNRLALSGIAADIQPLRHTPAGIPVAEFVLKHESEQTEAGTPRRVELSLPVLAMGEQALPLSRLSPGERVVVAGFLAQRSRMSLQPVLHVDRYRIEDRG